MAMDLRLIPGFGKTLAFYVSLHVAARRSHMVSSKLNLILTRCKAFVPASRNITRLRIIQWSICVDRLAKMQSYSFIHQRRGSTFGPKDLIIQSTSALRPKKSPALVSAAVHERPSLPSSWPLSTPHSQFREIFFSHDTCL